MSEIDTLRARVAELEAQAAAMRRALTLQPIVHTHVCLDGDGRACTPDCRAPEQRARLEAALAPDAGRRVMAVVEAARRAARYLDGCGNDACDPDVQARSALRSAIAVLDEVPR